MVQVPSHRVARAVGLAIVIFALHPTSCASQISSRRTWVAATRKCTGSFPTSNVAAPGKVLPLAAFAIPPSWGFRRRCQCLRVYSTTSVALLAKPKRGSVVDSYQTVAVNCSKCRHRLFRYKKKNGTKSNLVKCFTERIVWDDDDGAEQEELMKKKINESGGGSSSGEGEWFCPECGTKFARSAMMRGMPALKLVGGKVRMTKK